MSWLNNFKPLHPQSLNPQGGMGGGVSGLFPHHPMPTHAGGNVPGTGPAQPMLPGGFMGPYQKPNQPMGGVAGPGMTGGNMYQPPGMQKGNTDNRAALVQALMRGR